MKLFHRDINMKVTMNLIKFKILLILLISIVSCSVFKKKSDIKADIINKNLIFNFEKKDIMLLGYEINSLETFKEDGLTYRNILKYKNYDGFYDIVISNYKSKNILDNHAYYLLVTKEGAKFETLSFCIKNNFIKIQKYKSDDKGFVNECHNL